MRYVIIYWSRYGNGKKVVEKLDKKLTDEGAETKMLKTDDTDPTSLPEADVYIFSAPTEAFNIQRNMRTFMKKLPDMDEKKYGIINTHAMNRDKLNKMEKILSKKNMIKIADVDFQVGKNANTGNGLMKGWETKIETFAEKLLKL